MSQVPTVRRVGQQILGARKRQQIVSYVASALHVGGPRFHPQNPQVRLGKTHCLKPGDLLPVNVDALQMMLDNYSHQPLLARPLVEDDGNCSLNNNKRAPCWLPLMQIIPHPCISVAGTERIVCDIYVFILVC